MEENLFSLNNLRAMEVIDVSEGKKLGLIADVKNIIYYNTWRKNILF